MFSAPFQPQIGHLIKIANLCSFIQVNTPPETVRLIAQMVHPDR